MRWRCQPRGQPYSDPSGGGIATGADCLAPVGRLDTELEKLEDHAGTLGDYVHSDLTCEAADGLTYGDRPQGAFGLTESHHGRRLTTSERSRRSRSDDAGRVASRTCEGQSPDRPAPEVDGKERRDCGLGPSRRSEPPVPRPGVASSCPRDLPREGRGAGGGKR